MLKWLSVQVFKKRNHTCCSKMRVDQCYVLKW